MKRKVGFLITLLLTMLIGILCLTGCGCTSDKKSEGANNTTQNVTTEEVKEPEAPVAEVEPQQPTTNGHIIVIDPGHQTKDTSQTEPVGPGSSEMKAKDTSGATGVATGLREYELNLQVSNKLKEELEKRGYEIIMTRTSNEGEISCIERAEIANNVNADAFIRVHANSVDDSSTSGAMTICMTSSSPYNSYLYNDSKRLSVDILDELVTSTGCKKERVWETDSMTGTNWSKVPVTIVEMGYMSNPNEDRLMATDDYQWKIATGIANGIDRFINGN